MLCGFVKCLLLFLRFLGERGLEDLVVRSNGAAVRESYFL